MFGKKIAFNTLSQVLSKIITSASGFFITILIARYYGAIGYGEYTKITAFIALFYLIADFGLNAVFLQFEEKDAKFSNLLSLRLLSSFIIVLFINCLIFLMPYNSSNDIGFPSSLRLGSLIFSITVIFQSVITSSAAIFQKKLRYDYYFISVGLGTFVTLLFVILFSTMRMPLEYVLLSYVLGSAVSAIISLILQKEKIRPLRIDKKFTLKIMKSSLPLGLMLFFNLVYFRIDIIILSFFKKSSDVAIYGYAYKYFEFLLAIPLFISNSIYPLLLRALKNLRIFYNVSQKFILLFLILSLLVLIPSWYLSPLIAVVKTDFLPSVPVLRYLLLSLPIFFLTNIFQWILIANKKNDYLLKVYIFCALVNTSLNYIFIPFYSYYASVIITVISEGFVLSLLFFKFLVLRRSQLRSA